MNIRFCDLDSMIVFANNSKGELVFIDDVENGYKCDCFCLNCHGKLNAKNNGNQKAHHFAHANGSDCKKGHENTLPFFVQRILNETKWMLLPRGNIKLNGEYINDYQPVSIIKTELKKVEGFPPVLLITTSKEKHIALFVVFTDDYLDRELIYRTDYDNLIRIDIRSYRGSVKEVEPELKHILTHRYHGMKWIKRYDESSIKTKIGEIAIRKSFGYDALYCERYYCPKEQKTITESDRSCKSCPYFIQNIIDGCMEIKCLGFLDELSIRSISNSKKPDYSSIPEPSYLELHSIRSDGYNWLYLNDLPRAYPNIDCTLVFDKDAYRVFLVSLKAISTGKTKGLEINTDGIVEYNLKSIISFSSKRSWRICSLSNYKIKQEDVNYLLSHI